jgi:osmoprotectant transport system permease protein
MPVYLAGVRVMAVSTISLVTVGSVIGIQSLGTLFTDGFQRGIVEEVLCGLVFTVVLALIVDAVLVVLGKMFMPWTKVRS